MASLRDRGSAVANGWMIGVRHRATRTGTMEKTGEIFILVRSFHVHLIALPAVERQVVLHLIDRPMTHFVRVDHDPVAA